MHLHSSTLIGHLADADTALPRFAYGGAVMAGQMYADLFTLPDEASPRSGTR
jgi:hypothetical protein